MNHLQDLNIKKEILPIFDYSLNSFTKNKILYLLETPLVDEDRIIERQNILRAFGSNMNVLENYSYTVLYLNEVHFFLNNFKEVNLKSKGFLFSGPDDDEILLNNKLHQMVVFFYRLESVYFSRIDIKDFPEVYRKDLNSILSFLSFFELRHYELIIREKRLKRKHLKELANKILKLKTEQRIEKFWEDLFLFESYCSISLAIKNRKFSFPAFEEKEINLNNFYHPLIKNPVKNDFRTFGNVIILNGPNMSGKSTFLKSISLCVYLGNLGLAIPASKGIIPVCSDFSIGINKRDDISSGYSHFMTEVMNLKDVVVKAGGGKKCFAVFDELFSGTNVEDATEICRTTIHGLSKFSNSYFFISTHIQELRDVTNSNISTFYLDCELVNNVPTFTYKLKQGWSDIKVGRILFDKVGLNELLDSSKTIDK
ncbi:MutS-related protein [Flavobacterium notoginsengisoli]|uniref:MutS-related protein n=1 Tax=Flavobacterium notoginsengisoli TaxID=1478199 RepID=UPI0036294A39